MKKFKNLFASLLCILLFVHIVNVTSMAQSSITVTFDGEKLDFDVPPMIINNRTMVPMRKIFEHYGADVQWNPESRQITAQKDDINTIMQIDNCNMLVNGENITLDVGPVIVNSRTLVPVRAISEALNSNVNWNDGTKTVYITTNQAETETSEVQKIFADRDWVYDAKVYEDWYEDGVGNTCHYKYDVPAFNIDSADAQKINSDILSYVDEFYQGTLQSQKIKESLFIYKITNSYYVNGDIVSLVIQVNNDWGATYTTCYNINKSTGKIVSNSELASSLGYQEAEFVKFLKELTGAFYVDLWSDNSPDGQNEFYWDRYNYTVSDEVCNMSVPMFIGENGNLFIVAKIGSLAGAGSYEFEIDTKINVNP